MIDDDHNEAAVNFELFLSEIESELFTGCGTRFSCNEFDTSLVSSSCIENIR